MKNQWFTRSVRKLSGDQQGRPSDESLSQALDTKYGDYNHAADARVLCREEFESVMGRIFKRHLPQGAKVLLTGANSGVELPLLSSYQVTAFDLSSRALEKIRKNYPHITAVQGNVEALPFRDDVFAAYIGLRVITSSNVDLYEALKESARIAKSIVIYSIPNGYVVDGKLVPGMYETKTHTFDLEKPYTLKIKISDWLRERDFVVEVYEVASEIIIVGRKLNKILGGAKYVVDNSKSVQIDHAKIDMFVNEDIPATKPHWLGSSTDLAEKLSAEEFLHFLVVFDTLSFSYWGNPKWAVEYRGERIDGSYALVACIQRAFEEGIPVFDFRYLSHIPFKEFAYILRGTTDIPLLKQRWRMLREVASILVREYGGSVKTFIEKHGREVNHLRDSIVKILPSFSDEALYKGHKVLFHKRAQILIADIYHLLGGKEPFADFENVIDLTAGADYKLPQILRRYGILVYENDLARKVDNETPLVAGSEEEVEIRANTIWAVECIRAKAYERGKTLSSSDINDHLWLSTQKKHSDDKPYHLTRTTAY